MTKKDALALALEVVKTVGIAEPIKGKLEAKLKEVFASNAGRSSEPQTKTDANGKVTHIRCAHSKLYLPANAKVFYEEKREGKGILGADGKKLKNLSRAGEAIYKKWRRDTEAKRAELSAELLGLDVNAPDFKQKHSQIKKELESLPEAPDYSVIDVNTGLVKVANEAPKA